MLATLPGNAWRAHCVGRFAGALKLSSHASGPVFYGWWVLAGLFLAGFVVAGGGIYSFVLFIDPWTREFGWSRATTSGLVSSFWFAAPLALFGGKAVQRFGVKRLLIIGVTLEALSVVLLSLTDTLWQMYALRVCMGFGKVMFAVCIPAVLATWFDRYFTFALSIAWAGWGTGGLILGPLTSVFLEWYGWRATCVAVGAAIVLVGVSPLARILRIQSPADLGLKRDGLPRPESDGEQLPPTHEILSPAAPGAEDSLLRSRFFWTIAIATIGYYAAYTGVFFHEAALISSSGIKHILGHGPSTASLVVAATAGLASVSAPVVGRLLDKGLLWQIGLLMHIFLVVSLLAAAELANEASYAALLVFVVSFGGQFAGADLFWTALLRRCFPHASVARTYGAWYFFEIATFALAPIAVGRLFDVIGSYIGTMLLLLVPVTMSLILMAATLGSLARNAPTTESS